MLLINLKRLQIEFLLPFFESYRLSGNKNLEYY